MSENHICATCTDHVETPIGEGKRCGAVGVHVVVSGKFGKIMYMNVNGHHACPDEHTCNHHSALRRNA